MFPSAPARPARVGAEAGLGPSPTEGCAAEAAEAGLRNRAFGFYGRIGSGQHSQVWSFLRTLVMECLALMVGSLTTKSLEMALSFADSRWRGAHGDEHRTRGQC